MKKNNYSWLLVPLLLSSTGLMALPSSNQQAILNTEQATALNVPHPTKNAPALTRAEQIARIKELMKNPAFKAAVEKMLKHPNLTFTAKSVFTPAGIPMQWGGVGFSGGALNGAPSSDGWLGSAGASLPFGDSDKIIGGAVSVNWANINHYSFSNSELSNNTGTVSLIFSRWLAANTIASAGIINLGPWGFMKHAPKSYNAVVTQMFGARIAGRYHPMSASVGIGSGMFGPIGSVQSRKDSRVYPFVNGAFNFTRNTAITGDYYSETFALGLSYNTLVKAPIVLPLSFMVFAGNLKHSESISSTLFGFRVSTGVPLPSLKRTPMTA